MLSDMQSSPSVDQAMLFITTTSVFNAVAYTGGPYPLGYLGLGSVSIGYSGLGDLFVFLYFGLVATLTVPYISLRLNGDTQPAIHILLTHKLMQVSWIVAFPIGFLATAIIVVNNLRDRVTDVSAKKLTMAVRFGETFTRREYLFFVFSAYAMVPYFAWEYGWTWLFPLLSLRAAIPQLVAVAFGGKDGGELNAHVGGTARVQLLFCILLVVGIKMSA